MIPRPAIPTNCPICGSVVAPDSFQPYIHQCSSGHYHYIDAGFAIQEYMIGLFAYELIHFPRKIMFNVHDGDRHVPRHCILQGKLQETPTVEEIFATLERVAKVHCMV